MGFIVGLGDRHITLKISTSSLRTINKIGITAAMKKAKEQGFLK